MSRSNRSKSNRSPDENLADIDIKGSGVDPLDLSNIITEKNCTDNIKFDDFPNIKQNLIITPTHKDRLQY